jgi:patatin-like phospholipase/acyl hydrolase
MKAVRRYRKPGPANAGAPPFQILSLSGGGYRGLFTAIVLEELEQRAGRPLAECFDLVAGTSIGGILACGLMAGVPAATIRKEFERLGDRVFDKHVSLFGHRLFPVPRLGLFSARYSRAGLEEAVDGVLGPYASRTLAETRPGLLVPAVSATSGEPFVFETGPPNDPRGIVTLRDVAFATSAAPTFFPEHAVLANALVDGGVIANAPDVLALVRAMSAHGRHPSEIRILSVGTSGAATGEVFKSGRKSGVLGWMVTRGLYTLTLNAQQSLALSQVRDILGNRFVRIDIAADGARGKAIALDKTGMIASATLRGLAAEALSEADRKAGPMISAVLRNQPAA